MTTNHPVSLPTIVKPPTVSPSASEAQQHQGQGLPLPFIAGHFKATRNYSEGGMSRTYLGFQLNAECENKVIIKIPNISYPESVKLFESECSLLESLDNDYIAKCLECGSLNANGTAYPYMVMDFIDGQTVEQRTQVKGKMEWLEVKELLMDMCQALKYLHEKNICHRDIKPANIIYDTQNKRWMLVDFGIAKDFSRGNMPTILSNAGTWDYMAPEQLYKGESGDVRSDIYSLGMVAWQALIGEVPRPGTKYPHEAGINGVSVDVDKLISTMVHQDPAKRYQSPTELEKAIKVGARRVEKWQQAKMKMCKISKWSKRGVISVASLIVTWWIGNNAATAYIKNAVEEKVIADQISAALTELNSISNYISPLGFAKEYIEQENDILSNKLKKKHQRMEVEYRDIQMDADVVRKAKRMKIFTDKWSNEFKSDPLIGGTLRSGDIEEVIELENIFKETSTHEDYLRLADKYGKLIKSSNDETERRVWEGKKDDLDKTHWDPWLQEELRVISHLSTTESITRENESIENMIALYGQIEQFYIAKNNLHNRRNTVEAKDWENTVKKVNGYILQRDFVQALITVDDFVSLYPDSKKIGRQTVNNEQDRIFDKYVMNLKGKRNNYDNFRSDFDVFNDVILKYKSNNPYAEKFLEEATRDLLYCIHLEIYSIMNGGLSANQKKVAIKNLNYNECAGVYKTYLDELTLLAIKSLSSPSLETPRRKYIHKWFSAPLDCVPPNPNRWMWRLKVHSVAVSFSEEAYKEIVGLGPDAFSYFRVGILDGKDDIAGEKWKIGGPKNTKCYNRSCESLDEIYFDSRTKRFIFEIGDADAWPDYKVCHTYTFEQLKGNTSKTIEAEDGTKFTVYYTID